MNIDKINCIIFENCNKIFPALMDCKNHLQEVDAEFELVAKSKDESNLKLIGEIERSSKKFYIRLYLEFLLNENVSKHPNFLILMDVENNRAEVISFESNLFPPIRLDSYTEIDGQKYTNKVATYDITLLCDNWLKQLIELEYKTIYNKWKPIQNQKQKSV
jgi:hypothetical protein